MLSEGTFLTTQKGKPCFVEYGFEYVRERELANSDMTAWRCALFRSKLCRARLQITQEGQVEVRMGEHNHSSDVSRAELRRVYNDMKQCAARTDQNVTSIIAAGARALSEHAAVRLPSISTVRRTLRAVRKRSRCEPSLPRTLSELLLPDALLATEEGSILLHDSGEADGENRIVLLSRPDQVRRLSRCAHLFVDGTFHAAPSITFQLFTVHGLVNDRVVPLLYAFLPDKKQRTYVRVFRAVCNALPSFRPISIMMDFEAAVINACRAVFPEAELHGCFFHLCQAVFRKVSETHRVDYVRDSAFKLHVKMLSALAFMPVQMVAETFDRIAAHLPDVIADYFERTYIGRFRPHQPRQHPLFPIEFWNVRNRILEALPRTNNSIEGWHNRFNLIVGAAHPTVFKAIEKIKAEMDLVSLELLQSDIGSEVHREMRYARADRQILNLSNRLELAHSQGMDEVELVRSFALNLLD